MASLAEQGDALLPLLGPASAGYGLRPLPDSLDEEIARVIAAYLESTEEERAEFTARLDQVQAQFFTGYGERMASLALKLESARPLRDGLVAIAISAGVRYFKEVLPVLALLDDSARKLGEDPAPLFQEAAAATQPPPPEWFTEFTDRPEQYRTPEAMGFEQHDSPEGLHYHQSR